MYELVIIWETGEQERHTYATREDAEKIEAGYVSAFGSQVVFTCVNERSGKK